jgi:hypothetical protein
MPTDLGELETKLRELSHDSQALDLIQEFADKLGKMSKKRNYSGVAIDKMRSLCTKRQKPIFGYR